MVIAALQDCRGKFSCLTGNILAHPASPGCEYRFLLQQRGRILIAIGFSEEQKLPITKSRGAAVEGDSLKIEF